MAQPLGHLCERSVNGEACAAGPGGAPAQAVAQVEGRWYCQRHLAAFRAVASKRRDRGFGSCSIAGCSRPAAERDGKCEEHRAGERAAGAPIVVVDAASGRGGHPYAPKRAVVYLAVFRELARLKVGKATPWTVSLRVANAAEKLWTRREDGSLGRPTTLERDAWFVPLFGDENVLWSVSERVEHAAAGKLAHNVRASSVDHTQGKEWLRHDDIAAIDWPAEFHRAVRETLVFLGHDESEAGPPEPVL